jgi:HEAT repeats
MKVALYLSFLLAAPALMAQPAGAPEVKNARFETLSPAAGLEAALRQGSRGAEPVWVGYSVPMIAGRGRVCCFSRDWKPSSCSLEGRHNSWGSSDRDKPRQDQRLNVLLRFKDGKVDEIRGFSEDCPLDAGNRRFVWLGAVKPEESVAYLADLARAGKGGRGEDDDSDEALSTLAQHRNANADAALEDLASSKYPLNQRDQALFWLGQTRGERGARFLAGVIRDDRDDKAREKAVFSLSQSPVPWAAETIIHTAKEDRSGKIRGEALFWLAQMGNAQAPAIIFTALNEDPDMKVRKQAVFALSQLHESQGVPYLVRAGKEARHPEVRKEAYFWLAQSKDPEALKYLDKVLNED